MRHFILGLTALALAGCALPVPLQIASWAASGISYMATGKSMSDHAMSAVASKDCAMHRVLLGGDICSDFEPLEDGTALARKDGEPAERPSADRLRDGMIALAESLDGDLAPASGPSDGTAPAAGQGDASGASETIDSILLAVTDTIRRAEPAPVAARPVVTAAVGQHYLVLGKFRDFSEAEDIRARYAELGTAVRMVLERGNLLFQVTAGPFSRPEAVEAGETLADRRPSPDIAYLCADRTTPAPCAGERDDGPPTTTAQPQVARNR